MDTHIQLEREVPPRDARQKRWLAWWREVRSRGRLSYILRRGILIDGVVFGVLMITMQLFGPLADRQPHSVSLVVVGFVFYAVFFGTSMGLWTWRTREKRFRKMSDAASSA
jgi:hypothetical protein